MAKSNQTDLSHRPLLFYKGFYPITENNGPLNETLEESWLITLSDLMSMLLIIFLIWTTIQISSGGLKAHKSQKNQSELEKLKALLLEYHPSTTSSGLITVLLQQELYFPSGSERLKDQGKKTLAKIAPILASLKGYEIKIIGHTDKVPMSSKARWKSNLDLSMARATSVWRFLVENGVPSEMLSLKGLGPAYASGGTGKNDAPPLVCDRRVELVLMPVQVP